MHFTGRTWRPPYEANSCIIELTTGCTHNRCSFCNLYQKEPFTVTPLSQFKEDLAEIKSYQPNARRIFLTGANPFALHYDLLKLYILTIHDYLIKCQKLDAANITYYFVYMTGLAGKGKGSINARNSANIFNQLNPQFISIDSLTLFPNTKLYQKYKNEAFIPAGEKASRNI